MRWGWRGGIAGAQDVHENWQAKKTVLYLGAEDWAWAGPEIRGQASGRVSVGRSVTSQDSPCPQWPPPSVQGSLEPRKTLLRVRAQRERDRAAWTAALTPLPWPGSCCG